MTIPPETERGDPEAATLPRAPKERVRRRRRFRLDGWPPFGWRGFDERKGDGEGSGAGNGEGGGDEGGNGGRGGGGGGSGDDEPHDPWRGLPRPGTSELAMTLVLVAICTLFLIFLGAWLLLRKNAVEWPPPGTPGPPAGLWVSSLLLVAASGTLARALAAHRRLERRTLLRCLFGSAAIGLAFLGVQAWLWHALVQDGLVPSTNGYGAIFYALTGLHAAHILGGLFLLVRVLRGVLHTRGSLGPEAPVRLCGAYWHVMGGIWLVIFGALALPA